MRYKQFRRKPKSIYSLAFLETLDLHELLQKKEMFEIEINFINKLFDKDTYENSKLDKDKLNNILKLKEELWKQFRSLKGCFKIKSELYATRGFFGGISELREILFVHVEENNKTEIFLKKLKDYYFTVKEFKNCTLYNNRILSSVQRLVKYNGIEMKIHSFDHYKTYFFDIDNILNIVKTGKKDYRGNDVQLTTMEIEDSHFDPTKVFYNASFWKDAERIQRGQIDDIDKRVLSPNGYRVGKFFKTFSNLNIEHRDFLSAEDIIYKEKFLEYRNKLLDHFEKYLRKTNMLIRSKERGSQISENLNTVYILTNKSYPNVYKVGWTSLQADERADQLSSETGVLYPFKVVFEKKFKDAEKIEKKIHKKFNSFRVRKNKEYFEIDLETLKDFINTL